MIQPLHKGRVACVQTPAFGGGWMAVSNFYDGAGSRLLRVTRTGQPGTLYAYDELGSLAATALDVDGDGQIDYAGDDRISSTATRHEPINGDWWRVTTQSIWHEAGVDACLTTGVIRVRLTGFGGWDDTYGGNLTARSETLDARGNVMRSSTYTDAAVPSSRQVVERPDSVQPALSYSVAGRPYMTATAAAVTNYYAHDGFARQTALTDGRGNTTVTHYNALGQADWTENAAGNRTTYGYDALGRQTSETDALTNTVHTAYDSLGNVVSAWGATYPVEQDYDTQGRKVSMKTFRDEEGAGDETRWLYDNATGLLTNKMYADGMGTAYTYTPDGKLAIRTWARGVTTTYAYTNGSSLVAINYSDSTPDAAFQYDRLGRQVSVIVAVISTNLFTYNGLDRVSETQNGVVITRTKDALGRPSGFSLDDDYAVAYDYDDYGRFSQVSNFQFQVAYSYFPGTYILSGMSTTSGFSWIREYEPHRDLVTSVENRLGETPISRFDYDNDPLAKRTRRIDNLNVTNNFGYNGRSEVIGAAMGTNTFSYAYDPIGNRLTATNNQEGWVYQANPLNQYTNILEGAAPSAPLYDLDGNMTAAGDGWWYAWNGENRMVLASNAQHVVTYAYDHQGRMVAKTVDDVARQYIWDGYNIIREAINHQQPITNHYVWSLDLSGTLQGASGVGGVLAEIQDGVPYFAAFDANGNVTEHVTTNGTIAAHYEYSPFGEIVVKSGDIADSFTHRFSTKPWCATTGLSEYKSRKYGPGMGRWLSRDPIGNMGGLNIMGFVGNSVITHVDALGEKTMVFLVDTKYYSHTMEDVAKAQKQNKASLANMDAFEKVLARIPKEAITAALKDGRFTLNGKVETSMTYEKLRSLIERERTSSVTVLSGSYGTDISAIEAAVKALDKPYDEVAVAVHGVWFENEPKPSPFVAWGAELVLRTEVFSPLLNALAGEKAIINSCFRTWTSDQKNNRELSAETLLFSQRQTSDSNPAYGGVTAKFVNGKLDGSCWIVFRTARIGKQVGAKILKGDERYEKP